MLGRFVIPDHIVPTSILCLTNPSSKQAGALPLAKPSDSERAARTSLAATWIVAYGDGQMALANYDLVQLLPVVEPIHIVEKPFGAGGLGRDKDERRRLERARGSQGV